MIGKTIQTGIATCGVLLATIGLGQAEPEKEGSATAESETKLEETSEDRAPDTRPPAQILVDARTTLDRMEAAADNVGRMLRAARLDKDVVKVVCLDDKLSQMNVAARSAADRVSGIESGVQEKNDERVAHDTAVLEALASRSNDLAAEANQCIGAEQGTLGDTELKVTIDPSLPSTQTDSSGPATVISAPPVAASPTQ